jgi:DNA-binding MarR family transcriptional regulator
LNSKDEFYNLTKIFFDFTFDLKNFIFENKLPPDFGIGDFMIIFYVYFYGNVKMSEISKKMHLTKSAITTIIDKLEVKKVVYRERSKKDRRVVYIKLSEAGLKLCEEGLENLKRLYLRGKEVLNAEEFDLINHVIFKLSKGLKEDEVQ